MVFSSLAFLLIFLPVVWLLYQLPLGMKFKNGLLLFASLLFYAMGEPVFVLFLLASCLFHYLVGLALDGEKSKVLLALTIVCDLFFLCFCKYTSALDHLPVGVSFYTFQALSYVIDVYRKPETKQRNLFRLMLYISFFPQLIAGPIVKYHDISEQMEERSASIDEVAHGLRRFIIGLSKKVLIANTAGKIVDTAYGFGGEGLNYNAFIAWTAAILYCIQIYYDFSGYSDMALGLAETMGFHLKENFMHPYGATSMKDFWRRWHISLSTWFKEYLYIPLGGNRKGKLRTYLNKYLVFFCTGIWHGAGINFIIWGLMHGSFTVLEEKEGFASFLKKHKLLGWLYSMLVVTIAFVFFKAESFGKAIQVLTAMFTGFGVTTDAMASYLPMFTNLSVLLMGIGIFFSFPVLEGREFVAKWKAKAGFAIFANLISLLLLVLCIMSLAKNSYNPFIYFRF